MHKPPFPSPLPLEHLAAFAVVFLLGIIAGNRGLDALGQFRG
jgi:hypothetical protein